MIRHSTLLIYVLLMIMLPMFGCGDGCRDRGVTSLFVSTNGYTFDFKGQKFQHTDQGVVAADVTKLSINNQFGDVSITASDTEATWQWQLTCWSETAEVAKSYTGKIELVTTVLDGEQLLQLVLPKPPIDDLRGVKSDLTIRIPSTLKVELTNTHGASTIDEMKGGVFAQCKHVDLSLQNLEGELKASTTHASLTAQNIPGGILSNKHGNITAKFVSGDLTARSSHADMLLDSVDGHVHATNQHGKVATSNVTGELHIRCQHSDVVVKGVSKNADCETSFAKLEFTGAAGDVKLRNEHGDIIAKNINGKFDGETKFGNIDLEITSKDIFVRNEHGEIHIVASNNKLQRIDAETSFGDLLVTVPADVKPTIEAGAKSGEIDSAFPVLRLNSAVDNFRELEASAARMTLKNQHGDIQIRRK